MLYIAKATQRGSSDVLYKVGVSGSPKTRVSNLNTIFARHELVTHYDVGGYDYLLEKAVHGYLDKYRIKGSEYFTTTKNVIIAAVQIVINWMVSRKYFSLDISRVKHNVNNCSGLGAHHPYRNVFKFIGDDAKSRASYDARSQ